MHLDDVETREFFFDIDAEKLRLLDACVSFIFKN